ncbi:MAG TPA: T9SS type A sorting domain-containing protein [Flavobacteriales bacterium]|nr:T9SS type A sorting domain-containing protein [Flavobacteriales bacterium]
MGSMWGRVLFLLVYISAIFSTNSLVAQNCPSCVIDATCDSVPAQPKLCPAVLPTDTAQQYYEADATFYMPTTFTDAGSGVDVDLLEIEVVGISGLPTGLTWSSYDYMGNDTLNFYPPENPPSSERGCAKICGTPLMPGNYIVTVSVLAYVYVPAISSNMTQATSFDIPLTIVPGGSGNSVFTMSNNQGCDSVSTDFSPILQSGGDPLYVYSWDFGDSITSTSEFPSHTYSVPGTYVVTGQIDVLKYAVSNVSVTVVNDDWCGDIEELWDFIFSQCLGNPDVYFRLNDNNSLYDSPTINNNMSPSWTNLGAVIEGAQFTIQFFDEDDGPPFGSPDDDLGSKIINITGPQSYQVSTISPYSGTQAITGSLTIITQLDTSYIATDTIRVYQPPIADTITFSPSDSICTGDSVTLVTGGGDSYQWYSDDTTLIVNATDSTYVASVTGNYWCQVIDTLGCSAATGQLQVAVISYPIMPSVINMGNNFLQTFSNVPNLQWHFEGAPIPGETGQSYIVTQDGNYFLTAANVLGCVSSSDTLFLTYIGLNEFLPNASGLRIYPNPSKGDFTITLNTFDDQQIIIKVRDIIGRTVYAQDYGSTNGLFESAVDLGDVISGVYTVNVSIGDYSFHQKLLVK